MAPRTRAGGQRRFMGRLPSAALLAGLAMAVQGHSHVAHAGAGALGHTHRPHLSPGTLWT